MSPRKKTTGDGGSADTPVTPPATAGDPAAPPGSTHDRPSGAATGPEAHPDAAGTAADAGAVPSPGDAGGDPTRRRRRGTRGGRRHRKAADKTAASSSPDPEAALAATSEAVAEPAPAQRVEESTPPPAVDASAPRRRAPRGRGAGRGAAKGVAAAAPERKQRRPARPAVAADAGASGASADGTIPAAASATTAQSSEPAASGEERPAAKRRHRGTRGGRRRHKAQEAAAAEAAREAEEAAGEPGEAGEAVPLPAATPAPTDGLEPASGGAEDEAAGDEAGQAKRGRRRRLRGRQGGESRPADGDVAPAEASPADTAPEAAGTAGEPAGQPAAAATDESAGADGEVPAADGTSEETAGRRRRRGGRRGRGRRGAGSGDDVAAEAPADETAAEAGGEAGVSAPAAPEPGGEPGEPAAAAVPAARAARPRRRDRRRPAAIVRQDEGSGLGPALSQEPLQYRPAVTVESPERKTILVTDDGGELRVALVEDGRLAEIYIERPERKSYLGDIYQGKVENVLPGIDAAFVDFGLEKNGFLYVDEVTPPEGEKRARRIGDAVKNGQQVLVQVTKDPMGSKGARLSTKISLAGRYLVYVPGGSGVGVSRRLRQSERERLREVSKQLKPRNAGLIVRTIAEGHGLEDLRRDMQYLSRLWSRLKKKAETVKAPGLVHKEVDISLEVTRDLFNDTCESLVVDDVKRHKAILAFLDKEAPELLPKVHLHSGEAPLFEAYGIEEQIARALERRVPLPSGGNLVIDHAEALTVIDVNTGRFTRGKGLEDTITKTNLEAATEVVRQLRLRDIGGIIIIDFIDMAHAKNREMVLATLEAELETDRTKTYVVELSPLGLVEMTRQNTTDGARGILTRSCPACSGKARVLSEETMALSVERRLRTLARRSQAKAWLVEVNAGVADRFTKERLKRLEKQTGRRVFLEGGSALPVDAFRILAEGPLAHVQEQRVPLREGQETEVELEFSLTYSPRDAVGYVDGYMVIVEGGRQALGQRRKVRVTATGRTGATATLLKQAAN